MLNMKIQYLYTILVFVIIGLIFPAKGTISEISKDDFLEILTFMDSMINNISTKYVVDEERNKKMLERAMQLDERLTSLAEKRSWDIEWRKDQDKYYFDVDIIREDANFPRNHNIEAYDGQYCQVLNVNDNRATIHSDPIDEGYITPLDFCHSMGDKEKGMAVVLKEAEIKTFSQTTWQDHQCYFVEATLANASKLQAWIDPNIGYKARCIKQWNRHGQIAYEASADYKEIEKDIWFPVSGVSKLYTNDKDTGERVISCERTLKVDEVNINKNLNIKNFSIELPIGTKVYDEIYGIGYIVGLSSIIGIDDSLLDDIAEAGKFDKINETNKSSQRLPDKKREVISQNNELVSITNNLIQTNKKPPTNNHKLKLFTMILVFTTTVSIFAFISILYFIKKGKKNNESNIFQLSTDNNSNNYLPRK